MCNIDLAAVATFVLAIVAVWAIFESRKATDTQIAVATWIEFGKQFDSADTKRARAETIQQLHSYSPADHRDLPEDVLELFETIGIAYNRGRIDKELADESFSYYVNRWWIIAKPYIEEQRRRRPTVTQLYYEFETMASAMGVEDKKIDTPDISAFVQEEKSRWKG
jgi:hypothetical protein